MAFTATQYLAYATTLTATTSATGTPTTTARFSVIAMTISNTATTNQINFVDIGFFNGTVTANILTKAPIYPNGALIVEGVQKHTLPTSGYITVTPYATSGIGVVTSGVEIT